MTPLLALFLGAASAFRPPAEARRCSDVPLHACSIQGNREEGKPFGQMLAMGASRPWPDALEVLTGEKRMEAGAMPEYFAPLRAWLADQSRGRACGW